MATLTIYLVIAGVLIFLNAMFVLGEFAIVKLRPSRVEQMANEGRTGAKLVTAIQANMDEYLSVCQVGITFTSIGLGFVGEPAFAQLFLKVTGWGTAAAHTAAVTVSYVLVSFLHILFGELVPKSLAIRRPEGSALAMARPLRFFRWFFYPPMMILNGSANWILRVFGIHGLAPGHDHSEEELRILLAQSQSTGMMSFRRLLLLENIFDLADIKARDVMRGRDAGKVLRLGSSWEENFRVIHDSRFSRFPVVDGSVDLPVGIVHVKDLLFEGPERMAAVDLRKIARPYLTVPEDAPLEGVLGDFQRTRSQMAIVKAPDGRWSGTLTFEDIIEEIVGNVEDEFETEPPIYLADALTPGRIALGVEGSGLEEAIGGIFGRLAGSELPLPVDKIVKAVLERERAMSTYLGNGLAIPHARLDGLERPVLLFGRSDDGIPVKGRDEKAQFIFVLLTPMGQPRAQVRLLSRICGLVGSEYVVERLKSAATHAQVVEAIRAGEPMTQS